MYILGPRDTMSIPVRVNSVETVANEYHGGPELHIVASLSLSPNSDNVDVILWAGVEAADTIKADDDFVCRDITLQGYCSGDHPNPYGRSEVGILAISFGEDRLALVQHEVLG